MAYIYIYIYTYSLLYNNVEKGADNLKSSSAASEARNSLLEEHQGEPLVYNKAKISEDVMCIYIYIYIYDYCL